jgi:transcriptional regulator with XRE-family HTH domain
MQDTTYAQLRRFGKTIKGVREEVGLSQEAFAERCGLTRTHVGKIERAEQNVSFETISRICRATKLRQSELFARAKL